MQFGDKVRELDRIYAALRHDVEALLLTAPSAGGSAIDQLLGTHAAVVTQMEDQVTILGALQSDFRTVQHKVEDWARAVASEAAQAAQAGSPTPGAGQAGAGAQGLHHPLMSGSGVDLEELRGMEEMNRVHRGEMLPRVRAAYAAAEELAQECLRQKNAMTAFVCDQLQRISSQQSKIRDMRNKLAAFSEVATKQADAFTQLGVVSHVPIAYRQCMAECVRRHASLELFKGQAGLLAERMGRMRDKEVARREAFKKRVERVVPAALMAAMGLLAAPPHCEVGVPPADVNLLQVSMDELRRLGATSAEADAVRAGMHLGEASASASVTGSHSATSDGIDLEELLAGEGGREAALKLENARLRAELAHMLAIHGSSTGAAAVASTASVSGAGAAVSGSIPSSPRSALGGASRAPSAAASHLLTLGGSVLAALSQGGAASTAAARHAGEDDGMGSAGRGGGIWQEALAAKDSYIAELQQHLAEARGKATAYGRRVAELEALQAPSAASSEPAGPRRARGHDDDDDDDDGAGSEGRAQSRGGGGSGGKWASSAGANSGGGDAREGRGGGSRNGDGCSSQERKHPSGDGGKSGSSGRGGESSHSPASAGGGGAASGKDCHAGTVGCDADTASSGAAQAGSWGVAVPSAEHAAAGVPSDVPASSRMQPTAQGGSDSTAWPVGLDGRSEAPVPAQGLLAAPSTDPLGASQLLGGTSASQLLTGAGPMPPPPHLPTHVAAAHDAAAPGAGQAADPAMAACSHLPVGALGPAAPVEQAAEVHDQAQSGMPGDAQSGMPAMASQEAQPHGTADTSGPASSGGRGTAQCQGSGAREVHEPLLRDVGEQHSQAGHDMVAASAAAALPAEGGAAAIAAPDGAGRAADATLEAMAPGAIIGAGDDIADAVSHGAIPEASVSGSAAGMGGAVEDAGDDAPVIQHPGPDNTHPAAVDAALPPDAGPQPWSRGTVPTASGLPASLAPATRRQQQQQRQTDPISIPAPTVGASVRAGQATRPGSMGGSYGAAGSAGSATGASMGRGAYSWGSRSPTRPRSSQSAGTPTRASQGRSGSGRARAATNDVSALAAGAFAATKFGW